MWWSVGVVVQLNAIRFCHEMFQKLVVLGQSMLLRLNEIKEILLSI